jgi:hypothetical protein
MTTIMLIEGRFCLVFPAWRGVDTSSFASAHAIVPGSMDAFFLRPPRAIAAAKVLGKTMTVRRPQMWRFRVLGVIPDGRRDDGNVIIALAHYEYAALDR